MSSNLVSASTTMPTKKNSGDAHSASPLHRIIRYAVLLTDQADNPALATIRDHDIVETGWQ
jgi:hypothetical protein